MKKTDQDQDPEKTKGRAAGTPKTKKAKAPALATETKDLPKPAEGDETQEKLEWLDLQSGQNDKARPKSKKVSKREQPLSASPSSTFSTRTTESHFSVHVNPSTLHRKLEEYKRVHVVPSHAEKIAMSPTMSPRMHDYILSVEEKKHEHDREIRSTSWSGSWDKYLGDDYSHHSIQTHTEPDETIQKKPKVKRIKHTKPPTPDLSAPKVKSKARGQVNEDIFGYRSKLAKRKGFIFGEESGVSSDDNVGPSASDAGGRDMSWIRNLSPISSVKAAGINNEYSSPMSALPMEYGNEREHIKNALNLFWGFLLAGGRMPFIFIKNRDTSSHADICKFDRGRRHYYMFASSSIFLIFLTIVTLSSFMGIFFAEEDATLPYTQLEKLLFEKNWLTGLIFLASLITASLASWSILTNGDAIADYITEWDISLDEFNFDATNGIKLIVVIFMTWSATQAAIETLVYAMSSEMNAFIEGTHFVIVLIFRFSIPEVLLSGYVDYLAIVALFLQAYALYCSRSFILFIMVYATGITNLANEWNLRLRIILQGVTPKGNEYTLKNIREHLNYARMFARHNTIVKLVKDISQVFELGLLSFYIAQALIVAGIFLEVAIYINPVEMRSFDQTLVEFLVGNETLIYEYDKGTSHGFYEIVHMSQSIAIFLLVSWHLAGVGETVMEGIFHIRRHAHMNTMSTHQRDFVMSLMMSFSDKRPYLLSAGRYFSISRSFMLGFMAISIYFFSVMVQCRIPSLLSIPVVFPCANGTGICFGSQVATQQEIGAITNMSIANIDAMTIPNTTVVDPNPNTTVVTPRPNSTDPIVLNFCNRRRFYLETVITGARDTNVVGPSVTFPCSNNADIPALLRPQRRCRGTSTFRPNTYEANGNMHRINETWWDCIYRPYRPINGPYYDCFGNRLDQYDDCGMLNFGHRRSQTPGRKRVEVYRTDPDRYIDISCWDLHRDYFSDPDQVEWYPCGMHRWFASTVCHSGRNDNTGALPSTLALLRSEIKRIVNVILSPPRPRMCDRNETVLGEIVRKQICDGSFNYQFNPLHVPGRSRSISPYFPYFSPEVLGDDLNTTFVYHCGRGFWSQISHAHDDCGQLDFDRNVVQAHNRTDMNTTFTFTYKCFAPCPTRVWHEMSDCYRFFFRERLIL